MSPDLIISGIVSLLGLAATIFTWVVNPKRVLQVKLAAIDKQITEWGTKRDEALIKGDMDGLTIATNFIVKLMCSRKALLL
jgi:hypothetical protein